MASNDETASHMATHSQSWPLWWRVVLLSNLCVFIVMGNWFTACLSPVLGVLAGDFRKDFADITHLITYVLLSIGLANIIAVPISQFIGKRYTVLLSLSLFLACNIWCYFETRYKAFEAARILGGLGAGIIEALGPLIVAECFPERQLASVMVIYVLCLGAGSSIGPFISGALDKAGINWHWNFVIIACILGGNLLSCIIMLPETIDQGLQRCVESDNSSNMDAEKSYGETHERVVPASHVTADEGNQSLTQLWVRRSFFLRAPDVRPERNFFLLVIQPWSMLAAPAVAITSLIFGLMIAYTVIASVVISGTLQQPPILWTPFKVGLINLSTFVGLSIGIPLGGIIADVLSRRSARRNDGIHIRESRLPALLSGFIIGPLGVIIMGVCLQQNKVWAGLAIGWAMLSIALTAAANVLLTYAVDCYPWRAADIGVVVNTLKNVVAFSVGYGTTPWLQAVGPLKQFATMAGILWFFSLFAIPLYVYGPKMRQWSLRYIM